MQRIKKRSLRYVRDRRQQKYLMRYSVTACAINRSIGKIQKYWISLCEKFAHRNTALRGIAIRASNFRLLRRRVRIVFDTLPKRQLDRAMSIEKARETVCPNNEYIFFSAIVRGSIIIISSIMVYPDHARRNNATCAPPTRAHPCADVCVHSRPLHIVGTSLVWRTTFLRSCD